MSAKVLENDVHVFVVSWRTQELLAYRDLKTNEITVGDENKIQQVGYVAVLTRVEEELDNLETGGWKVIDVRRFLYLPQLCRRALTLVPFRRWPVALHKPSHRLFSSVAPHLSESKRTPPLPFRSPFPSYSFAHPSPLPELPLCILQASLRTFSNTSPHHPTHHDISQCKQQQHSGRSNRRTLEDERMGGDRS